MDDRCRRRLLATGEACRVERCSCGTLHVSLGALTLRLEAAVVADAAETLERALVALTEGCALTAPHDPTERELALAVGSWEVRVFTDAKFGFFVERGLWHVQLWHPEARVSVLTPSRLTRGAYEIASARGTKQRVRTYADVARVVRALNLLLGAASALAFPATGIATHALANEGPAIERSPRSRAVPPERKTTVKSMKQSRMVFLGMTMLAVALAAVACGDDDVVTTPRNDGGTPDATNADTGGGGGDATTDAMSACGLVNLPADYVSTDYETNAKTELDLRAAFSAFLKPMSDNEAAIVSGDAGVPITSASLDALWSAGTPSVKSTTSAYWAARVTAWLTAYQTASNEGSINAAMEAVDTLGETSPANGGFYGRYAYDGSLVDLRQAIEKGTFTAGFFNHAAGVVTAGNLTEATTDRLLAAWGAHPSFQNSHVANDAGTTTANRDINSAGYAARRTKKDGTPGIYTRAKAALIKAKAAIAAGESCNAERDQAIQDFFLEWEKGTYATVVFYLSDIVTKLATPPAASDATAWTSLFHAHGECIGFLGGFKQTPQAHRKITDAQIDGLLSKALLPEGGTSKIVELKTNTAASVISLNGVLADIKTIYGFSDEEMTSFKTVYSK